MITFYWVPEKPDDPNPRVVMRVDDKMVAFYGMPIGGGRLRFDVPENDMNQGYYETMAPPYYKHLPGSKPSLNSPPSSIPNFPEGTKLEMRNGVLTPIKELPKGTEKGMEDVPAPKTTRKTRVRSSNL